MESTPDLLHAVGVQQRWVGFLIVALLTTAAAVPVVRETAKARAGAAAAESRWRSAETGHAMAKAGATGHYTAATAAEVEAARVYAESYQRVATLWTVGSVFVVAISGLTFVAAMVLRRRAARAFASVD